MTIKTHNDSTGLDQLDVRANPARDAAHFRRILAAGRQWRMLNRNCETQYTMPAKPATPGP